MKRGKGGCTYENNNGTPCNRKASCCTQHHLAYSDDQTMGLVVSQRAILETHGKLLDDYIETHHALKTARTPLGVYNTVMSWPPDMQERFRKMWDKRNAPVVE